LKDSNAHPKMETTEGTRVGVCSLACSISRVRGACWSFKMGIMTSDKQVNYLYELAKTKQQVG